MDRTRKKRVVLSITRVVIHNGPGIRTLVLFKGCPLRCLWCSTPESQKAEPEIGIYPSRCNHCGYCVPACPLDAISLTEETISINRAQCNSCGECAKVCLPKAITLLGRYVTVAELVEELEKDAIFFKHSGGGVTISGGEPLLQPDFTKDLVKACREKGISMGIDTCGHVPWTNIEHVLPYVYFFLWDIKHMDSEKHRELTGVPNELILSNARSVSETGIPLYIRIPVIPGYNDSEENIRATCEFASSLPSVVEVHLLPVHHLGRARYESLNWPYPIADVCLIPDDVLQAMERLVESYGLKCRMNG
ncbi:MAG: glycyl-radical enzyme activating protein [Dehalococcoidia bacterium]|nr:glycyl-radical enzyme activating protein [Dehalococcoidia bacterium]